MDRYACSVCVAALSLVLARPVSAQETSVDPPAHIAVVEGTASLERDGRPDPAPASMPLLAGDRLRTENGRLEVLFADGATLHLDSSSTVDFQSDEVIRLLEGRVRVTIPGPRRALSYRIDAPAGWVQIDEPGEYRVAVTRGGREAEVELVVLRGAATLLNEGGQTALTAGERAFARADAAPSYAYVYNSAAWDAFDRWSESRRAGRAGASAQYLPETVAAYSSTFDRDGDWRRDPSYGYVWYPTVSAGWRPYFHGRWATVPSYGWTWIGTDAWAWPTHHYGRWGFSAGAWFWIPGRTWGPAWVSWAYAPGYVSWCPLGWDNRAVFQFGRAGGYRGGYDYWHAWTVVPRQRFGAGYVHAGYVGGNRIDPRARGAFAVGAAAPAIRGYATARTAVPIRVAGSRGPGRAGYNGQVASQPIGTAQPRTSAGVAPGAPRSGMADEAAAQFRSRRPAAATTSGPGFPAPARSPRTAADVTERMATPGERSRSTGNGVTVYRGGAVTRTPERSVSPRQPDDPASRRLDMPGYRRSPGAVSAPGAAAPTPDASRTTQRTAPTRERQTAMPDIPVYRGGRLGPERQPEAPRAVPRQAPDGSAPPIRSYGGVERRAPPPPPAAAPREQGPPPSAGAPRGDAPARNRSSGQSQPDRGGAVRRSGGRG